MPERSSWSSSRPASRGAALADRLRLATADIIGLAPAFEAAAPLDATARLGDGEDAWGPREVLAHVSEAAAYWAGEIERILAGDPGAPVPFGRTSDDVARVAILARDRSLPPRVLLDRLAREIEALAARLETLGDADLDRLGRHPRRGVEPLAATVEGSLIDHFEGHAAQVRAAGA